MSAAYQRGRDDAVVGRSPDEASLTASIHRFNDYERGYLDGCQSPEVERPPRHCRTCSCRAGEVAR